MKNVISHLSLREIQELASRNFYLRNMLLRLTASSYESFVKVLYDDLESIIRELELNPQHYKGYSEDKLTITIVTFLKQSGYNATHGTMGGGSKDITVIGNLPSWSWIGEAKIYNSISNLREGFLQLTTRYRNNDLTNGCGGLLAYTFRDLVADKMAAWKEAVSKIELRNFSVHPCESRGGLAFTSVHDHVVSGLPYTIRHLAICLHHSPKDKSGRTAKKHRESNCSTD